MEKNAYRDKRYVVDNIGTKTRRNYLLGLSRLLLNCTQINIRHVPRPLIWFVCSRSRIAVQLPPNRRNLNIKLLILDLFSESANRIQRHFSHYILTSIITPLNEPPLFPRSIVKNSITKRFTVYIYTALSNCPTTLPKGRIKNYRSYCADDDNLACYSQKKYVLYCVWRVEPVTIELILYKYNVAPVTRSIK